VLNNQLADIDQLHRSSFCFSGEEAVIIARKQIQAAAEKQWDEHVAEIQPIAHMLLDL
jgi:hypothetical protein